MHTRNSTFRTASTLAEIGSDRWTTVAVEVAAQYGVELHWTEDGCFEAVGPPLIIDCFMLALASQVGPLPVGDRWYDDAIYQGQELNQIYSEPSNPWILEAA